MNLAEKLDDFAGALTVAISCAPNDYPEFVYSDYIKNKADLLKLWSEIEPRLKRDLDKAAYITQRLHEGFEAYDAGDKEAGEQAMLDIYNLHPKKLR
jgi:hypothetical protein